MEYGRKGFDKIELLPSDHEKFGAEGDLIPSTFEFVCIRRLVHNDIHDI